jgi:hypothetical protein
VEALGEADRGVLLRFKGSLATYGRRLAASELVASMGTIGDALDNAVAESLWGAELRSCSSSILVNETAE